MTTHSQAHESFAIQSSDPAAWLELARTLRIAAAPIRDTLFAIADLPQTTDSVRLQKLAYVRGYMLLTGLAFENLLKAIALSRRHDMAELMKLRSGHGLVAIAQSLSLHLTPDEQDFLRRLEEYVVWAGRYTVSRAREQYVASQRDRLLTFRSDDPQRENDLFDRLTSEIKQSA